MALAIFLLSAGSLPEKKAKPVIFLIGDSTVKNGTGKGDGGLWGWGAYLHTMFDTSKVSIRNYALGGRSSRTFITQGLWDKVLAQLKPGDYVLIQFGHNDSSPVNDDSRARGTLRGTGEETEEIDNILTKQHETVHTYGWYLRKYIYDAKARGAMPVICSLVPRNIWENGKVARASADYGLWARETAEAAGAGFIDLNEIIAVKYEALGQQEVSTKLFLTDHTHTNEAGAIINAAAVTEGIKQMKKCKLKRYLRTPL
ncbi:MAG: rhamnogalacturonan acetylesterase [Bacteroidales bacterium]|nr:rhamnogalacturonan acetylesterase [Bacteroidales bacterium]